MATRSSRQQGRSGAGTSWLLAGYAGAAGFLVLEVLIRRRGTASRLDASSDDEGTTRMLLAASGPAVGLPLVLRRLPVPQLPWGAAPMGLTMQASGLALRVWSMRTLGTFYTRTLRTAQEQPVVDTGPYRMVRHPGYAGAMLIWIGLALTSRSALAIVLVAGLMGRAYQRRIIAEEKLLQGSLPGYLAYSRHTKKLIPFVW